MNKFLLQLVLVVCVLIESVLLFQIFVLTDVIHNALYTGLAILVLLSIIRLLNNLTNDIYGNNEKN